MSMKPERGVSRGNTDIGDDVEGFAELIGTGRVIWAGRTGNSRWQRGQIGVGALCGESSLDARAAGLFTIAFDALV